MALTAIAALEMIQRELSANRTDKVPDGWLTTEQWACEWGKSYSHTGNLLVAAHRSGLVLREQYRIVLGDSIARPVWHYKPKSKAKKK